LKHRGIGKFRAGATQLRLLFEREPPEVCLGTAQQLSLHPDGLGLRV
jgi:hypothetical protein